jgi:hypothetical protein
MLRNVKFVIFIILLFSYRGFGTTISVGNISILADSPTAGDQEVTISNYTGPGNCSISYAACSSLDFIDWTLTVNYTSSYYSGAPNTGGGPTEPNPFVTTSATHGVISPSPANMVFDFDLCGGVNIGNCTPTTTITSIEFAGQIAPSSFCLFDQTANGCPLDPQNRTTFFANPNFDLIWNGSSPTSPFVNETTTPFTTSPDITVTDQTPIAPEPGSFLLMASMLPLAWMVRRRRFKAAN